ncbi:MAG: flotillin family protein, partial [Planctomycetales bacterium]|nr:flotillin family protein [Planctomycetales bacterium]
MDPWTIAGIAFGGFILFVIAALFVFANFYKKVGPEEALIRSGQGGLNAVTGSGIMVYPVLHRVERMDLSVKRIEIHRRGEAGLICKDNIR